MITILKRKVFLRGSTQQCVSENTCNWGLNCTGLTAQQCNDTCNTPTASGSLSRCLSCNGIWSIIFLNSFYFSLFLFFFWFLLIWLVVTGCVHFANITNQTACQSGYCNLDSSIIADASACANLGKCAVAFIFPTFSPTLPWLKTLRLLSVVENLFSIRIRILQHVDRL